MFIKVHKGSGWTTQKISQSWNFCSIKISCKPPNRTENTPTLSHFDFSGPKIGPLQTIINNYKIVIWSYTSQQYNIQLLCHLKAYFYIFPISNAIISDRCCSFVSRQVFWGLSYINNLCSITKLFCWFPHSKTILELLPQTTDSTTNWYS